MLQRAAIPAANDEHALRLSHRQHRHMDNHLVITHVVALGQLDDAIQDHRIAEELCFDKLQMLVLCLFIRKDALDAQTLAVIRMHFMRAAILLRSVSIYA